MERKDKINFLTHNIKGIGPSKANLIVDTFEDKNDILSILDSDEDRQKLKSIINHKLYESVITQFQNVRLQGKRVEDMLNYGIPYTIATTLAKEETYELFKKSPYIVGKNHNVPFEPCDRYAHTFSTPDLNTSRMQSLIEFILQELEASGHTFTYLFQLAHKINQYQRKHNYIPCDFDPYTLVLFLHKHENIEVQKSEEVANWKIFRKEIVELESNIAKEIKRLSNQQPIGAKIPFKPTSFSYDDVQLSAIQSCSIAGLKIITGPPGSGKTAVINGIIQYFKQLKPNANIILCAPTGRAAKHMTEITNQQSSTIHKLLAITPQERFFKTSMLDCDMLICDESSMLNLEITYELLSSIPKGSVVYFVGDKDQLPSIGAGNVLHDIINSNTIPTYYLTKVYRQDGIILENAHQINHGIYPSNTNSLYQSHSYNDEYILKKDIIKKFQSLYNPKDPFETQILVPSYKSECGIFALNQAIQKLNPSPFVIKSSHGNFKEHDKILMTKNHKSNLYQNGSVGIFLCNRGDNFLVEFEGEQVELPRESIEDMTLGYAISVHKSQGTEYNHVLLCLPSNPSNMLKRNIAYTAVTRAKKDIAIYEMEGAMKKAISTNLEPFVQTGLKEKLIKLLPQI